MHKELPPSPEEILRLKEDLTTGFRKLPPEHQASMGLVLLSEVMKGEWGTWLKDAILRRYEPSPTPPESFAVPAIDRNDLHEIDFSDEDIARLSDDDLARISNMAKDHFAYDLFWNEVRFLTDLILVEKGKP